MIFKVDRRIFDDECIASTLYWLSSKYVCKRNLESDCFEIIELLPISETKDEAVEIDFWGNLNDQKLRGIIARETKDIKTVLYAKAFSESEEIAESDFNEL